MTRYQRRRVRYLVLGCENASVALHDCPNAQADEWYEAWKATRDAMLAYIEKITERGAR